MRILRQFVTELVEEGGLEAAEAIVVAGYLWLGKGKGKGVALVTQFIDHRATRVAETHHLGTLVKGLARSIVDRLADDLHIKGRANQHNLRIAPRYQ